MNRLDPKDYNIKSKIIIEDRNDEICIVVNRKSRIIMKDGERLLGHAKLIQNTIQKSIAIETTAPVCSKTKAYLIKHGISIKNVY